MRILFINFVVNKYDNILWNFSWCGVVVGESMFKFCNGVKFKIIFFKFILCWWHLRFFISSFVLKKKTIKLFEYIDANLYLSNFYFFTPFTMTKILFNFVFIFCYNFPLHVWKFSPTLVETKNLVFVHTCKKFKLLKDYMKLYFFFTLFNWIYLSETA